MWKISTNILMEISIIEIEEIKVDDNKSAFEELTRCARIFAEKYKNVHIGDIHGVQVARDFFKAIGIDPTKRRPSSEALLNRALKGKELFSVNSLVDVGNWCSLEFLLPICIYDADKIIGQVEIRIGNENDSYIGLNNRTMNFHNRYVIADEFSAFGSPMTDSQRTAVDHKTHRAILGIFAPANYETTLLQQQAELFARRVIDFCGGEISNLSMLK